MSFFEIPLRGSFKRQIILTFVGGFFFMIAAFATYLITTEKDNLHRDSINETTSMAQSLAASALPWVLANDVAGLQETVHAFHAYPEFSYAMVISPAGKVLAHSDATEVGQFVTDEQSLILLKTPHQNRIMVDNEFTIGIAVPIEIGDRQVGWARVGSSKKSNADILRKMIWNNALFLLLATTFSLLASMLIANRLGRRIGSLVQVAENVQAGNFATRVNVSGGADEITTLGHSLNRMLDALSQNELDLRRASLYTRSLIEASVDPLVTISPAGKITDVNEATEKATGRSRSELIGTDFSDYFTEPDKAREGYQQVFAKGIVTDYPLALRHRDSHVTDVLYNASIYRDAAGQVLGVFAAARDITERKKAEDELKQLSLRNRLILDSAGEGIYGLDLNGHCTFINPAALQFLGFGIEEVIGQNSHALFHHTKPDGSPYPEEECPVQAAYKQGTINRGVELYWRKGGSSFPVEVISTPLLAAGEITGAVVAFRDISELKKAEEILRRSEASLAEAQRIAHLGNWNLDLANNVLTWSDEIFRIFEIDQSKFGASYEAFLNAIHPEDREMVNNSYTESVRERKPYDIVHRLLMKDGRIKFVNEKCETHYSEDGKPLFSVGTVHDITEIKKAELRLHDSEQLFRTLAENSPDVIVRYDREGKRIYVNPEFERVNHLTVQQVIGKTPLQLATELKPKADVFTEQLMSAMASGAIAKVDLSWTRDGKLVCWFVRIVPEFDADGKVVSALTIWSDITERKQAEEALRKSEERLRLEMTRMPIAYIIWDKNFRVTTWNPAAESIFGYTFDEAKGQHPYNIIVPPEAQSHVDAIWSKLLTGDTSAHSVNENITKDGRTIICEWTNTPLNQPDGTVLGVMSMVQDITERKRAEEEVHRLNTELEQRVKERTAELESFSYSVSHDLRVPLRAIDGFSRILLEEYHEKLDEEGKRLLGVVCDNTSRMARLIDDILAFSRLGRKEMATQEVDMDELVKETAAELAPTWTGRDVKLELGKLPPTQGDAAMLRQIWVNLLGNAVKFTRPRTTAVIGISGHTEGNETVYCVKDNGVGFDMQYVDKLFGVFQRLHGAEEFEGTGAGLAIVKRIVARHGGRVWAEGKVNEGATIYFALPAKEKEHG